MTIHGTRSTPTPRSIFEVAALLIQCCSEPPEFAEAFKSVKLDSADNDERDGERWVVIVAKGEAADRVAEAYDSSLAYERVIGGLAS